ncbi:ABC-type Na+ efflux pump permease subunit [Fictibacillus halophilus]|uniref:ABC-type Na+ efflux pump permease subunit n=1 Tax=Fictibacillus halophilus TaxID=1610490 RepID=A0ABV2LGZ4_9BACL|nr:hypothetical protein [Fictibacillus halophilus]
MEFLGFLISIIITIYLAINAPKYNKNPWLWAILGFFFGLITLGIFLIKTGRKGLGWLLVIISSIFYVFVLIGILTLFAALMVSPY